MSALLSLGLRFIGINLTKAVAMAALETLVKHTKTPYDDEVLTSVKKTMKWE